jgi:hypothetical protein
MSSTMMIHVENEGDVQIVREYPNNGNSLDIKLGQHMNMVLFLSKRDWWAMRKAFPRSKDYAYIDDDRTHKNGEEAEVLAAAHYYGGAK